MSARLVPILLVPALLLAADKPKPGVTSRGENEDLALIVTLHNDPRDIQQMLGYDLSGHYIVAEVKVEPKYGKEVAIDRDDFMLRTDKDGEKARPFVASQIAGVGGLVVSSGSGKDSGGIQMGSGYPGDYPGGYPPYPGGGYPPMGGPPVMMPGGVSGGGGSVGTGDTKATVQKGDEKPNPLKKLLEERMLANGKTDKPVSGLLYFPMEKQKMKDLELYFGGRENRITMRFKQ